MLTAVNNCVLYSNLKEEELMGGIFENVAPKHIIAYFIAVFNVMLATIGLEGLEVDETMQKDVQHWMDVLSGKSDI